MAKRGRPDRWRPAFLYALKDEIRVVLRVFSNLLIDGPKREQSGL